MKKMIIVNAKLVPADGKKDEIIEKVEKLLQESRTHEGNISYNLYSNVEDDTLMFVEKWESKEALEKHMKTEVFLKFGEESGELLAQDLEIQIFTAELITAA